jgi:Bacterial TSP3 repeat
MRPHRYAWSTLFSALLLFRASAVTLYVSLDSTNPVPPYADWSTAATNIQDAIHAGVTNDVVIVTNGVYSGGVRVTNALTLLSVNGPAVTVIQGYQVPGTTNGIGAVRCVYLASNATLVGFTLTNGATRTYAGTTLPAAGGGVECQSASAVVSNCIIVGNAAVYGAGAYSGTLINCVLSNNIAQESGGGSYNDTFGGCVLINCLLVGNSASSGGAVATTTLVNLNNCTVYGNSASQRGGGLFEGFGGAPGILHVTNCIVVGNSAPAWSNYYPPDLAFDFCCTTPLPASGVGNFTNDPLFIEPAIGDFHLQSNSPCINSDYNAYVSNTTDLEGNPRIVGGTVDIGAYEYQTPVSKISYAWLDQYGLPINTNTDATDSDGDGLNNYQEWIAGTNPTNALSVLVMMPPVPTNSPAGLVLGWQTVNNRTYFLQSSTNLGAHLTFTTIQSNIVGQTATTTYTDTAATNSGPYFYRVGVQ